MTDLATVPDAPDQAAILRALGLNPADPKTQALVLTCARYGLDPLLKHAVLIQGALYVTRDGLLHVAHESGRFDGMEVVQMPESESHYVARASVWRKDMGRPFTFQGRYPKGGRGGPGASHGPEMAEKVAVCRALRHAFDVALCSREEAWEDAPAPAPVMPQTPRMEVKRQGEATVAAMGRFAAACAEAGRDILDPASGRPSRSRMEGVAADALGGEIPETAERWDAATTALIVSDPDPETVDAEVIDPELAQIGDPFAKESEA